MNLRISQCSPLPFYPVTDDPTATALRFTQRFGRYDIIRLHAVGDVQTSVSCRVYDAVTGSLVAAEGTTRKAFGNGTWLYRKGYVPLREGVFYMTLTGDGTTIRSVDFEVTREVESDPDWVLFEYANSTNDTPMANETMFILNGAREVFKLRLPAGFKPQGYTPNVAQETWRTQTQELRQLYSVPFDKWTLTVGNASGVPVEYVRILNCVFSCDIVYINGERWCRSEGSVPDKALVMQGAQMFTVGIDIERQLGLEDYPTELYGNEGSYNDDYNNDYDVNQ